MAPHLTAAAKVQIKAVLGKGDQVIDTHRLLLTRTAAPGDEDSVTRALLIDVRIKELRIELLQGIVKNLRSLQLSSGGTGTQGGAARSTGSSSSSTSTRPPQATVGAGSAAGGGSIGAPMFPSPAAHAAGSARAAGSGPPVPTFSRGGVVVSRGSAPLGSFRGLPVGARPQAAATGSHATTATSVSTGSVAYARGRGASGEFRGLSGTARDGHAAGSADVLDDDDEDSPRATTGASSRPSGTASKATAARRINLSHDQKNLFKAWFIQNVGTPTGPYPNDKEKQALARASDTTIERVSNWFINARARDLRHLMQPQADST